MIFVNFFPMGSRSSYGISEDLSPSDVPYKHDSKLKDYSPICSTARRMPPKYEDVVKKKTNDMLKAQIVNPAC